MIKEFRKMNLLKISMAIIILLVSLPDDAISEINKKYSPEKIARQEINELLLFIQDGLHEVVYIVDIDSFLYDMRFYKEPLEDPYGTLHNCFIFFTDLREEAVLTMPPGFNEAFDENFVGSSIGIYKDGSILWMSEPEIAEGPGRLFTTRDINNDGKVEILTVWGINLEEIWIHSWDGNTGYRINTVKDDYFSVIEGMADLFHLFDANGDGILEIKNTEYDDGSATWSWNGSLYGRWPDTPHLPETTWFPRNNVKVKIDCQIAKVNDRLHFEYTILNDQTSKQRINTFYVEVMTENIVMEQPPNWLKRLHYLFNLTGWQTRVFDHTGHILRGKSAQGFVFITRALPTISKYYIQAYNFLPDPNLMSVQEILEGTKNDLLYNSVKGYTIGPADPPDPFSAVGFLDSLLYQNQMSDSLGWISDSLISAKYTTYFQNAKSHVQQNNNPAAIAVLDSVLTDVEADSGVTLSSEAYALIKYNTEYLKEQLSQSQALPFKEN